MWKEIPFEIASKDAVVNSKAVLAIGNTVEGWHRLLDWRVGLFSTQLKLNLLDNKSDFWHHPLVQRMSRLRRKVRKTVGRRRNDPMWISQKIYVPVLDGEIENQSVSHAVIAT